MKSTALEKFVSVKTRLNLFVEVFPHMEGLNSMLDEGFV